MNWLEAAIAHTLPLVPKPIVRRLSARYIAGETRSEAMATVAALNRAGFMATLDILGEFVTRESEAEAAGRDYRNVLADITVRSLDSNVSLKLTQMGLKLDPDIAYRITREVVAEAHRLGNFVRLDMEDSSCTTDTLSVHRRLREEFVEVGCVIQAYLKRSMDDVRDLVALGANVRLCKGIYVEPAAIAFQDPAAVNENFLRLLRALLEGGCYTGIATHDARLVEGAMAMIAELGLPPEAYEFQMLLGVTETLRASILERGHRLRVYVPYGSQWYAYSLRRLKENPQIAGYALKGLLGRG